MAAILAERNMLDSANDEIDALPDMKQFNSGFNRGLEEKYGGVLAKVVAMAKHKQNPEWEVSPHPC